MRSFCLIVLFAAIAAIDAQGSELMGPAVGFPWGEALETPEPMEPLETEVPPTLPPTLAPVGGNPPLMRGGRPAWPQQQQDAEELGQDEPADFINLGNGGTPFRGFKKPTKEDAKSITSKTIGIILSTFFVVALAAVVAVIIIRKKRSA